jgi:hypothetical protein
MADIIGQQRREQEVIKEAVAKRSLQEIQEEQAFQEWWDQESRRAQEEVGREAKVGAESEAVEEEVMGRWVGVVEGVKRRHQVQRNDRSVYILYILCRRFKRGKAQHMMASRRFYQ